MDDFRATVFRDIGFNLVFVFTHPAAPGNELRAMARTERAARSEIARELGLDPERFALVCVHMLPRR
jgi:hypothetical protein